MMNVYRFQCTLEPLEGTVDLQAYWVPYVLSSGDTPGFVGYPVEGVNRKYESIEIANQSILESPNWEGIAEQFKTEPIAAIVNLLETIKAFPSPPPNDLP